MEFIHSSFFAFLKTRVHVLCSPSCLCDEIPYSIVKFRFAVCKKATHNAEQKKNPIKSNFFFDVVITAGVWDLKAKKKTEHKKFIVAECSSGMNDNTVLLSMKRCGIILLLYCYLIRFQDNLTCRNETFYWHILCWHLLFIEYAESWKADIDRYYR